MGKTALLIEPGQHLGGLTSGGLGATDIGNKLAIGASPASSMACVAVLPAREAWKFQPLAEYLSGRQESVNRRCGPLNTCR